MFLQYLWGIETFNKKTISLIYNVFYSTYEELKQGTEVKLNCTFVRFLQYLWGIETIKLYVC